MKAFISLAGDTARIPHDERQRAARLTRVLESMTASLLQLLAERDRPSGRFFWDGLTGEFRTCPLVSALALTSADGVIHAEARLRNDEWLLTISVSLPDHALRGVYDRLHGLLNLLSYSDLEMDAHTVH
ncbi:hypothetical protein [Brevundimonas goettingensis]|uniref:Uncharacterized protein n=1 Tax=Brevundimonas goettingensis TaxID=2774190 RepID=A0A975GWN3_9CAUL|nr:hypothetical protein [Brevundimonas goettingensis]QTC92846.1 hypothetical protein IFJ75_08390 [Brevundimonas goettingensis]